MFSNSRMHTKIYVFVASMLLCLALMPAFCEAINGTAYTPHTVVNTGQIGVYPSVSGSIIVFLTMEDSVGEDLNGDGDLEDSVIRYYDVSTGTTTKTCQIGRDPSVSGSIIVFYTPESWVGEDLNGDGDLEDDIIRYYDVSTGTTTNTCQIGGDPSVSGSIIVFITPESWVGEDLNGDGDTDDVVIRYLDHGIKDSDGDGLTDEEEIVGWDITIHDCLGNPIDSYRVTSDPHKADEDGDGLNDLEEKQGWNVRYRASNPSPPPLKVWIEYHTASNPRSADWDNDNVTDWKERVWKTDPSRPNTDCDGAWDTNDGFEIEYGLNPVDCDTDDDGIGDGLEIDLWIEVAGYDPAKPELVPTEVLLWATSKTEDPVIPAFIDIDPDTLNLKSNGEWITCYIEFPEGYNIVVTNVTTVLLGGEIGVDSEAPTQIGDYDGDGIADLMVKFDRATIIEWLGTTDYDDDTGKNVEVTFVITGEVGAIPFQGDDTVRVLLKS